MVLRVVLILLLLASAIFFTNCGKPADPEIPAVTTIDPLDAAKKINTAGWPDSPFISRDGKRLYFMYSEKQLNGTWGTAKPVD